jgi:hypothetical protein
MKNLKILGLATLTVITNGFVGHFFPPTGMSLTPAVLIMTTLLVCLGTKNIGSIWISVLIFLFIALNDILIKLYAGGQHDSEGYEWVNGILLISLVPVSGILLTVIIRRKEENLTKKVIAVILFIGLIMLHFQLFRHLGRGRYY